MNIRKTLLIGGAFAAGIIGGGLILHQSIAFIQADEDLSEEAKKSTFPKSSHELDAALPMPEPALIPTSDLKSAAETTGRTLVYCPPNAALCNLATKTATKTARAIK